MVWLIIQAVRVGSGEVFGGLWDVDGGGGGAVAWGTVLAIVTRHYYLAGAWPLSENLTRHGNTRAGQGATPWIYADSISTCHFQRERERKNKTKKKTIQRDKSGSERALPGNATRVLHPPRQLRNTARGYLIPSSGKKCLVEIYFSHWYLYIYIYTPLIIVI